MNKRSINTKKLMIIGALALLAAQPFTSAQADLIQTYGPYDFSSSASVTDTNTVNGATTNNGASMGGDILITQFNASQGVLMSASHQLSSSRTTTLAGNGVTGTGTATVAAVANAKLVAPGMSATFGTVLPSPTPSCTSSSPCSYSSTATTTNNGSYSVALSSLNDYVGGGMVSASRIAPTLSVTSGGTKTSTSATATQSWSGTLTTSYNYLLHAAPSFNGSLANSVFTLDFGNVILNSTVNPLLFNIFNMADPNRVALDLDTIVGSGDTTILSTEMSSFMGLMSGSAYDFFAFIDTSLLGNFNASYMLTFSDEDTGAASSRNNNMMLTLNLRGNVVSAPALGTVNK